MVSGAQLGIRGGSAGQRRQGEGSGSRRARSDVEVHRDRIHHRAPAVLVGIPQGRLQQPDSAAAEMEMIVFRECG